MAHADNLCTRQQQLYKNPFSGGGVAWHQYFTLEVRGALKWVWPAKKPRDVPYHLKFLLVRMAKAAGFIFGIFIDQVSTNQPRSSATAEGPRDALC